MRCRSTLGQSLSKRSVRHWSSWKRMGWSSERNILKFRRRSNTVFPSVENLLCQFSTRCVSGEIETGYNHIDATPLNHIGSEAFFVISAQVDWSSVGFQGSAGCSFLHHSRWPRRWTGRYPAAAHSPLWDVSYRRICKAEEGRDEWYRPFRVSKGNFRKSENRTSGSLKNELLSCSEKGCQLKWHPFRALMPGCKLCFFGRFYVSPQISRKNGENKLHLEVYLYCSGKRTSPKLRPSVFPKETSWNLFWKHQEVSKRTGITADGQEDSDKTKGDVK